ncbi:hypothetical protein BGZ60DRAFT_524868 [Tricladium varicosporioides]|nr:hypothetical protein BGZ60DRAFT_524868 [Hymenoscyphus varicosporioides]
MSLATYSTDDWTTVDQSAVYHNLDRYPCAQNCVRNVNQQIWDVRESKHCQSYGCVCSESTQGLNFQAGLSNVTSCVGKSCNQKAITNTAIAIFADLCLVSALSSSRPSTKSGKIFIITSAGYPNTTQCAKFVMNGCVDENGIRNEPNCGPRKKSPNWEAYKGVADQRNCTTPECLCSGPNFDLTFGTAYDAGIRFCGMRPSTASLPNPELDDMMNVIATDCASYSYPPRNYTYHYSGKPPGSEDNKGVPLDAKVQIGLGAGGILIALASLYISARVYWLMLRA